MRVLLLLSALSMPAVAWMARRGVFGPEPGTLSDRYPTLLIAASYAFVIWGLIFLWDVLFGVWQLGARADASLVKVRPAATLGFVLTAAWMPIFAMQIFWLALIVIWGSLACLAYSAVVLSDDRAPRPWQRVLAWAPLSLHAGWLSLAAFLNTAQVIVAYRLLPLQSMLPWSLVLFAAALGLLLVLNARMRGNAVYVAVVLWGLVAVYVKQSQSSLPGAHIAAWAAVAIGVILAIQSGWTWARQGAHHPRSDQGDRQHSKADRVPARS